MASGQTFDVRHPEMVQVGQVASRICVLGEPDWIVKECEVSMLLMESLEPLDAPAERSPSTTSPE